MRKPPGEARALKSISNSTRVPVATLQTEKAQTGLSVGDLYVAHAIASAAGKPFAGIVAAKRSGKTWPQIAGDHNVSLGGKGSGGKRRAGDKVAEGNERDRQQVTPATSTVGRAMQQQSNNPANQWP